MTNNTQNILKMLYSIYKHEKALVEEIQYSLKQNKTSLIYRIIQNNFFYKLFAYI